MSLLLATVSSGMTRLVYPAPALVIRALAIPAPTSRSFAFVVVAEPLLADVPVPLAVATTSNGLFVSTPLYSAMRTSTAIEVDGV
jgi:hypothetical protein